MKNIWKILALMLLVLFLGIFFRENYQLRIYDRLFPPPMIRVSNVYEPRYIDRKSSFEKFSCKDKIVFIGNSITDGCEWNELLGRNDVVNRGIIGDTINGVLNRLDLYLQQKPKCIFIMIGINDIYQGTSMDIIQTNYSKIINKILENKIQLFIQSTLYTDMSDKNDKVKTLNDYLATQCKLLSIPYIDINGKLLYKNILSNRYSSDGQHLNGDGYIIWKEIISPYVNKIPY